MIHFHETKTDLEEPEIKEVKAKIVVGLLSHNMMLARVGFFVNIYIDQKKDRFLLKPVWGHLASGGLLPINNSPREPQKRFRQILRRLCTNGHC
ncbi:MAG: hypothetical protein P4L58_01720 [Candidatus Pacebacteria bacterium]|nr:hypothetical protein [Candidatus Paceibacterota bacterium]